ncbi:hypothetical protein BH23GEM3_BH23GEM3_18920 [soil metagenome]
MVYPYLYIAAWRRGEISMFSFILLQLTLREILADIPHGAPALIVYLMLVLFIGFIWYGSRSKPAGPPSGNPLG